MRRRLVMFSVIIAGLACAALLFACSSATSRTKGNLPPPTAAAGKGGIATAYTGKPYVIGGKTYFPPVVVRHAVMFMEGGTLSLLIVDARGKKLLTCNDGRSYLDPKDSPIERPIYIGGAHPMHEGSKPLPLGGADEQELYRMLKEWFDEAQRQGGPKFPGKGGSDQVRFATNFLSFLERHIELHEPK